jgi:hypothetical protein
MAMWVVPSLNVLKDLQAGFRLDAKPLSINQLAFEDGKETFTHRIIVAITNRPHRWPHVGLATSLPESQRCILSALIGMMNYSLRSPLRDGHFKSIKHEFRTQISRHRPTDHSPAEDIENHRQIQKSRPRRDVSNVSDPESVRRLCSKVTLDQIRDSGGLPTTDRRSHAAVSGDADQAGACHQSSNSLLRSQDPRLFDFCQNSGSAIGPSRAIVDLFDSLKQNLILLLARRWRTLEPGIKSAPGDFKDATLHTDAMDRLIRLYEVVGPSGIAPVSRANQAAAFLGFHAPVSIAGSLGVIG